MAETLSEPGAVAASGKLIDRLRITEIFYSLQGEADTVGWPTVFIRLTGCPLRCHYCDTTYAYEGGEWLSLADIMAATAAYGARYVTVTGGDRWHRRPAWFCCGSFAMQAIVSRSRPAGRSMSLRSTLG
jgi:hypothetical protein